MTSNKISYCGGLLRSHDPDRFLLSLITPASHREALWALFAFNYKIAKTREVVTDTTIGLIRLQWWRDALSSIYKGGTLLQNEILPDLSAAIQTYNLPREWFDSLIQAREFDLKNREPASLEEMEQYAASTNAALLKLALKVLGQTTEEEDTINAVATAYGLTGLLRAAPFHAAQNRSFIPADLRTEHNNDISAVSKIIVTRAFDSLNRYPVRSRFLKMVKVLVLLYLKQIKALKYDVFNPRLAYYPAFFHLRFLCNILLGAVPVIATINAII